MCLGLGLCGWSIDATAAPSVNGIENAQPAPLWGMRDGVNSFQPPGGEVKYLLMRTQEAGKKALSKESFSSTRPLALTVPTERLCEVARELEAIPRSELSLELYGPMTNLNLECLTSLRPTYLSSAVSHSDKPAAHKAGFLAVVPAVSGLRGVGYEGFGSYSGPTLKLLAEDFLFLASAKKLEALALESVVLDQGGIEKIAQSPLKTLSLQKVALPKGAISVLAKNQRLKRICFDSQKGLSGELADLKNLKGLEVLEIVSCGLVDSDLSSLENLLGLRELNLTRNQALTAKAMPSLSKLVGLEVLRLGASEVDSKSLAALSGMKKMRILELDRSQVNDAGMAHLANMHKLEELNLWMTGVTNKGLAQIGQHTTLRVLNLQSTKVNAKGMVNLATLVALEELNIGGTSINKGLKHLAPLVNLKHLRLGEGKMNDRGIKKLPALPSLRSLDLSYTKVSERQASAISKARPQVEVLWEDPDQY